MSSRIELVRPRTFRYAEQEDKPIQPDEIRLTGILSGISAGTELALYRGSSAFLDRRFDPDTRLFVPAENPWPQQLGYDWVGRITEVGAAVTGFSPGDVLHLPLPHAESQVISLARMDLLGIRRALPAEITAEQAAFLAQTSIALQAVHDGEMVMGDRIVVFGMGVLGLLTIQLLKRAGAGLIVAVDPDEARRQLALQFGAHMAWDPAEDVGARIRQDFKGFDVVIEFSGNTAALQPAVRSLRQSGRVVAAGFYQVGASELMLGEEWLHNRITMTSSNRGWGNYHSRFPRWNRARLREYAIQLIQEGALDTGPLIQKRIAFSELPAFFAELDSGKSPYLKGIVLYE